MVGVLTTVDAVQYTSDTIFVSFYYMAISFKLRLTYCSAGIGRGSDGYAGHEPAEPAGELCYEILSVETLDEEVISPIWLMMQGSTMR